MLRNITIYCTLSMHIFYRQLNNIFLAWQEIRKKHSCYCSDIDISVNIYINFNEDNTLLNWDLETRLKRVKNIDTFVHFSTLHHYHPTMSMKGYWEHLISSKNTNKASRIQSKSNASDDICIVLYTQYIVQNKVYLAYVEDWKVSTNVLKLLFLG